MEKPAAFPQGLEKSLGVAPLPNGLSHTSHSPYYYAQGDISKELKKGTFLKSVDTE